MEAATSVEEAKTKVLYVFVLEGGWIFSIPLAHEIKVSHKFCHIRVRCLVNGKCSTSL